MATITPDMLTNVSKFYVALFGRAPDGATLVSPAQDGLSYWTQELAAGIPLATVANQMFATDAARAYYPGYFTPQQIVDTFYLNVLGRPIGTDTAGEAYWMAALNAPGANAGTVIYQMIAATTAYVPGSNTNATIDAAAVTAQNLFANKVLVAQYYGTHGGNIAGATNALSGVTAVASTVTTAESAIDAYIANVVGQIFTLTTGVNVLTGTAGNDTFTADNSSGTAVSSAADSITGNGGVDTLKIYSKAGTADILPTMTGISALYVNGGNATNAFDISTKTAVTSLTVDGQVTAPAAYTVAAGQSVTFENSAFSGTIISADATTMAITVSAVTAGVLDIQDSLLTSATLTSTGAKNTITGLTQSAGTKALATLNIVGDQKLVLTESLDALKTINAATDTGGVTVDVSGTTTISTTFKFTGGTGNDNIKFAAGQVATGTVLAGGDGTDTLTIADLTLGSPLAGINKATAFEVLAFSGASITADVSTVTAFTKFDLPTAMTAASGGATLVAAATASVTAANGATAPVAFTGEGNTNTFTIDAAITGGAGQINNDTGTGAFTLTGGNGNTAMTFAPLVDNGSNALNLVLDGVAITGGAGGGAGGSNAGSNVGGNGGTGVDATNFEIVNIVSNTSANSLAGGALGAAVNGGAGTITQGTAGVGIIVGTNATINVSGAAAFNSGTITGTNVTVDAHTLTANLTTTTGAGNDVIIGGSGANAITLSGGVDSVNLSASAAKADTATENSAASMDATAGKFLTITGFGDVVTTGDKIDFTGANAAHADTSGVVASGTLASLNVQMVNGVVTFSGSAAATATFAQDLAAVYGAAVLNNGAATVAAFVYGGDTYVCFETGGGVGYTAGTDLVVKLVAITDVTAIAGTAAAHTVVVA